MDRPDEIGDELDGFMGRLGVGVVTSFVERVRELNPVLTGYSRAGWIASIGAPFEGLNGERYVGGFDETMPERALDEIAAWRPAQGNLYVTNNVDYVPHLNAQHPSARGYVLAAVIHAVTSGIRGIAL